MTATPATARPSGGAMRLSRSSAVLGAIALVAGLAIAIVALRSGDSTPAPAVFHVPGQPTGLAAAAGRVWVAGQRSGAVWELDAATGRRIGAPVRTGGAPARLALAANGAWIADTARGTVIPVQWRPRRVFAPVKLGADVTDVALAAGAVWAVSSADGTLRALRPGGAPATTVRAGPEPIAVAASARWVVVANAGDGTLTRVDARTRRLAGPSVLVGGVPVDVALDGDAAWVADVRGGTVRRVDLRTGRAGPPIAVGARPVAVAADRGQVYVLCDRDLVRLDGGKVTYRREVGPDPSALALDPQYAWVADAGDATVMRLAR